MSKNVNSSAFRKIDVDLITENFKEDDNQAEPLEQLNRPSCVDEQEVHRLVKLGKISDALKYLLQCFTKSNKNQASKDLIYNLSIQILVNVKTNEIEKIIENLDNDELDILMKYIYRGFLEQSSFGNSGILLVWHDKVYNKSGPGSICRVLTDKK